jgi:hypothetical protein
MILADFSHILTFAMLFIAAVFDLRSEKGDVPDVFAATAVVGGVVLHAAQGYVIGSWNPLLYSLGVGAVFSLYGWFAYWKGMWGGADAFALSALGFGAPFMTLSLSGAVQQGTTMIINLVLIASVYTIAFSLVRAYRSEGFVDELREKLYSDRKRILLELGLAFVVFGILDPVSAAGIYALIAGSIFLFRFLRVVEDHALTEEVDAEELEGGEVLKDERIRGVTEEELEDLDGKVEVMHGLRFVPVFPAALLLTDAGFTLIKYVIFV